MWRFAGKTATRVATLQRLPQRRTSGFGCIAATPPAISAMPLTIDQLAMGGQVRRHDPLIPAGPDEVHEAGEDEEGPEEPRHALNLVAQAGAWPSAACASLTPKRPS